MPHSRLQKITLLRSYIFVVLSEIYWAVGKPKTKPKRIHIFQVKWEKYAVDKEENQTNKDQESPPPKIQDAILFH